MKAKIPLIVRFLLALILLVFGSNNFIGFLSMPPPPEEGGKFLGALANAGYVFPAIGVIFIICAVLLATGRAIGLALILLAPICYHIIAYHLRFDVAGIGAATLVTILTVTLMVMYRKKFQSLLK